MLERTARGSCATASQAAGVITRRPHRHNQHRCCPCKRALSASSALLSARELPYVLHCSAAYTAAPAACNANAPAGLVSNVRMTR
jgi:hypothetical protein